MAGESLGGRRENTPTGTTTRNTGLRAWPGLASLGLSPEPIQTWSSSAQGSKPTPHPFPGTQPNAISGYPGLHR